jgi:hypothetical protein
MPELPFKINIYDVSTNSWTGQQDLSNTLLSKLITPEQASQLTIVKIDDDKLKNGRDIEEKEANYAVQLDNLNLGNHSEVIASSGKSVYFGTPEIAAEIRDKFFATQLDHCCRYGSLLSSSCQSMSVQNERPLTVRIVDSESQDPMEQKIVTDLETGDCHGKISTRLLQALGGKEKTPLQFRMANASPNSPLPPFLAKGTFLPDDKKTTARGYDLIIDKTSIKGWAKNTGPLQVSQRNGQWSLTPKAEFLQQQPPKDADIDNWKQHQNNLQLLPKVLEALNVQTQFDGKNYLLIDPSKDALDKLAKVYEWGNDRIATGTYQLPDLIIGNHSNAQIQEYSNSWQLTQWYSPETIAKDIGEPTLAEAQYLREIQGNQRMLAKYLVDNYDRRQQIIDSDRSFDSEDAKESDGEEKKEHSTIEILRADKYGLLGQHPKIVDFCVSQLRNRWVELATKGAVNLESGMAQPYNVKPGTLVAPHLENGTEVIVTRYPIVNKDNIRLYTVDNTQAPKLLDYQGAVFINPKDAMKYHQCDFDGDRLVAVPSDLIPNIAKETRRALEQLNDKGEDINRDFKPVVKRKKQEYTQGNLRHMALAVRRNSIGYIANAIGRVNCSQPNSEASPQDQQKFSKYKQGLLDNLFDALQIEVDGPKSSTRFETIYPELKTQIKDSFKLPFFDYKKDDRIYSSAPMPTTNSVVDILPSITNSQWQSCFLKAMDAKQFSSMLPISPTAETKPNFPALTEFATKLVEEFNTQSAEIIKSTQPDEIGEAFGKLYKNLDTKVLTANLSQSDKETLAALVWQKQHGNDTDSKHRSACIKLCEHFDVPIYTEKTGNHKYQQDLIEQPAYLIHAPFKSSMFANTDRTDCARVIKEILSNKGLDFEATVHRDRPIVTFAIKNMPPELQQTFDKYNKPETNRNHDNLDKRIAYQTLLKKDRETYNKLFTVRGGDNQYHQLKIVPPRDHDWIIGTNQKKAALAMTLFPDIVKNRLEHLNFQQLKLTGQKYNDYKNINFDTDPRYSGRDLQFVVGSFNKPDSDRHGDPMVCLVDPNYNNQVFSVAMFETESLKLPIGATFVGKIAGEQGALNISVTTGSVKLPELEMPQSPKRLRSKARSKTQIAVSKDNKQKLAEFTAKMKQRQQQKTSTQKTSTQIDINLEFSSPRQNRTNTDILQKPKSSQLEP